MRLSLIHTRDSLALLQWPFASEFAGGWPGCFEWHASSALCPTARVLIGARKRGEELELYAEDEYRRRAGILRAPLELVSRMPCLTSNERQPGSLRFLRRSPIFAAGDKSAFNVFADSSLSRTKNFSPCPVYTSTADEKLGFESELQGLPRKERRFEFKDSLGSFIRIRAQHCRWVARPIGAGEGHQNQQPPASESGETAG